MDSIEVVEKYQNEPRPSVGRAIVLADINAERNRQDEKWGPNQDHPDGTGGHNARMVAELARSQCDNAGAAVTWKNILCEEYAEAMAEEPREKLRAELIQAAAVIVSWVEALDRRSVAERPSCKACGHYLTAHTPNGCGYADSEGPCCCVRGAA